VTASQPLKRLPRTASRAIHPIIPELF
jgi:hypothetical protein